MRWEHTLPPRVPVYAPREVVGFTGWTALGCRVDITSRLKLGFLRRAAKTTRGGARGPLGTLHIKSCATVDGYGSRWKIGGR